MHIGWYHIALAIMACLALVFTSRTPRAWIWVMGLAASYAVSVIYTQAPKPAGVWVPPPASITFFCDAALAGFIHRLHRERWEWWGLFVPVVAMSMASFAQTLSILVGYPPTIPVVYYASLLEAINAICLALIGSIGAADLLTHGRLHTDRRHAHGLSAFAHVARSRTTASKARWHWNA